QEVVRMPTRQMVAATVDGRPEPDVVALGPGGVDEMLDLVARTNPGPFARRTIELGAYVGLRERGRLVAMAGGRGGGRHPAEISAVCTDPDHQGRGMAARLVLHLVDQIHAAGRRAFLHVLATNTNAARLYEHLGFVDHQDVVASVLQAPE